MASYDTIPTPAPEEGPKPKTLKRVLAAAALASFAFGALFAIRRRSGRRPLEALAGERRHGRLLQRL